MSQVNQGGSPATEAARITASSKSGLYTSFNGSVSNGASDTALTLLVGGSDFFDPLPRGSANWLEIHSSRTITLKFRTRANQSTATGSLKSMTIRANTTRTIDWLAEVTEIYFSNSSGSSADIDVQAI